MGGVRYDYSDVYGAMVTPRMHVRYNPSEAVTIHASAGKGYRSPHPLAEYSYLLASSRKIDIAPGSGAKQPGTSVPAPAGHCIPQGRGSSFQASTITLIFRPADAQS